MKHQLFIRPLWLLACCVLILTACIRPAGGANPLSGTKWQLVTLGQAPALPAVAVTSEFTDDALSGSAGCNNYSASYTLRDNTITIREAAATLMACADTQQMAQETKYLAELGTVTQFQVVGEQLELLNGQDEVVMVFEAQ